MPESTRNKDSIKNTDQQKDTNKQATQNKGYQKLPDNPKRSDENISTADNTAGGKYSKTNVRDEDIDNENTRGGR